MRTGRCWQAFLVVVYGVILAATTTTAASTDSPPALPDSIDVRVENGLVTLEAHDAPLADLLATIGAQAGFETIVDGSIRRTITVSFDRSPLAQALARLLRGIDYVALHAETGGTADTGSLTQLWLLADIESSGPVTGTGAGVRHADMAIPQPDEGKLRSEELLSLSRQGATPEVLETLGYAAEWDPEPLVRTRAAMALGALGDRRAVAVLAAALADDHPTVRRQAIQALSQIHDEEATVALGEVLRNDPDARQRMLAARALWRHDSDLARSFLTEAADDLDEAVRTAATRPPPAITVHDVRMTTNGSHTGPESAQ